MSSKLTGRDYEILQHLLRYKVATREIFHRVLFRTVSRNAVTKVVTRLVANGWLKRHPFLIASCYFTLSEQSARLFGMPESAIERAIPPRKLIVEYAVASYCCLGEKPRQRLAVDEIQQDYPHLWFDQLDSDRYYLDSGFRPELLGQIFVDYNSSPKTFLDDCQKDIAARIKRAAVRKLIQGGGFRATFLTAVNEKAVAIRSGIKRLQWPVGLRSEVVVVPNLINAVANLGDLEREPAQLPSRPPLGSTTQRNGYHRSRVPSRNSSS
jgi:hypothetical protein